MRTPCVWAMGFLLLTATARAAPPETKPAGEQAAPAFNGVRVFYFHRTGRCSACLAMEKWTREVVTDMASGRGPFGMEWQVVNLDLPEHKQLALDFAVEFSSVVVAVVQDGKTVCWENLSQVWDYCEDEQAFKEYLRAKIRRYMECATARSVTAPP